MSDKNSKADLDWLLEHRPAYENLTDAVVSTLSGLIQNHGIAHLSVSGRTKTVESFIDKAKRKTYTDPTKEITDLAGIRVITFIESDLKKVCNMIPTVFHVHEDITPDKLSELGVDKFGYRSVHFVCDLGEERIVLPEFSGFKGMLFEIQVRTVLQHAWAEIEHDRSYKFSGVLPKALRRRMHSIAGMLEIADREFDSIAHELDEYALHVEESTHAGDLRIGIDSTSMGKFLPGKLVQFEKLDISDAQRPLFTDIHVAELNRFDINTLDDVNTLLNIDYIERFIENKGESNTIGFLRSAMMDYDLDKYFASAWQRGWTVIGHKPYSLLRSKYDKKKLDGIFKANEIVVVYDD